MHGTKSLKLFVKAKGHVPLHNAYVLMLNRESL